MQHWPALIAKWLRALVGSDAAVAQAATLGNMRRLRWLVPIFLLFNALLLTAFVLDASPGTQVQLAWRQAVMQVYAVTAVVLVVLMVGAWSVMRRDTVDIWVRALQVVAPMVFLLFTVVLTVLDQQVTPNISPYLVGCMSISLLFLLPPATAVWLFSIGYALFFVGMGLTQSDATLLLTNRGNGFAVTALALIMSLVLWQRNIRYALLQRELTARNALLEKQQGDLVWLATRDTLTGLYNRGEFLRLAELELKRTQRHGGFTSAVFIDLDFFKAINDRHGHPAGDRVLVHVAHSLLSEVRTTDVVARVGGEEFMILLPNTDIDAATVLSEKLRGSLHDAPAVINTELQISVTGSFGVGCMPGGHGGTVASLYAAADNALYEAKRRGRDRVERTEPDPSLTPSDFQRMRA